MDKRLIQLNSRLVGIINFADPEKEKRGGYGLPIAAGVGALGTGAAGYGLYKRGAATGSVPAGEGFLNKTENVYHNIIAGAKQVPQDYRDIKGAVAGAGAHYRAARGISDVVDDYGALVPARDPLNKVGKLAAGQGALSDVSSKVGKVLKRYVS